jgi:hypothetical protein
LLSFCHHFAAQQAGEDAVFLGNVITDGKSGALFAASGNLVLLDQFADILESDRSLMQFNFVVLGQRVDQIRGRDRFANAVFPSAALGQIIEQKSDTAVPSRNCYARFPKG